MAHAQDIQPAAVPCAICSAPVDHRWIQPPQLAHQTQARDGYWLAPGDTDGSGVCCQACGPALALQRANTAAQRKLREWGADSYTGYRFGKTTQPRKGEGWGDFQDRVRSTPNTLGVNSNNRDAARAARDYDPRSGRWLLLAGEVGSGKSLLAVMLLRKLAEVPDAFTRWTWEDLVERHPVVARKYQAGRYDLPMRRTGYNGCRMVQEMSLKRHVDNHRDRQRYNRSEEMDPMSRLYECSLLVLDDLGVTTDSGKPSPAWQRQIECLIDHRYKHQKPTVITTNLSQRQMITAYGERVWGRIAERSDIHQTQANWREPVSRTR